VLLLENLLTGGRRRVGGKGKGVIKNRKGTFHSYGGKEEEFWGRRRYTFSKKKKGEFSQKSRKRVKKMGGCNNIGETAFTNRKGERGTINDLDQIPVKERRNLGLSRQKRGDHVYRGN